MATTITPKKLKSSKRSKKLDIEHVKVCACNEKHLNCLSAKEWIKSQLGVWRFAYEKRDIRDKNVHPATFPIALVKKTTLNLSGFVAA